VTNPTGIERHGFARLKAKIAVANAGLLELLIYRQSSFAPPPPLAQVPDEDISKLAERLTQDDRWLKNLIAGSAGIFRN
jgi:hypothetical protein